MYTIIAVLALSTAIHLLSSFASCQLPAPNHHCERTTS